MKRVFARIPRDKALLLLVAPLVVLVATVLATTMGEPSGPEARAAARKATTTTSAPGDSFAPLADAGASDAGSTADESLQFSDSSFDDGQSTPSSSGSDLEPATGYSGGGSAARRDAALGSDTSTEEASVGPPAVGPTGAAPTGASTTVAPAATTSVPAATTTTTVPMPPPALSESPITTLIPVSGVVVAGLGILWVARRRRRRTGRELTP